MSRKGKEKCTSDTEEVGNEVEDRHAARKKMEKELCLIMDRMYIAPRKKKLLVMNLNGFLLKRVHCCDKSGILQSQKPDFQYLNFFLYKRPFSEEFMKFCFERFEVGVWSCAMEHNIGAALTCAMGSLSSKLLFRWDQKECKKVGIESLENKKKPLYFKEMNKVFTRIKKGGPYDASNSLMIDDKPYKAFLNMPDTAIFPETYNPENRNDNVLDPNGELCKYLKGVVNSVDVRLYVQDNPYGQPPITPSHPAWKLYDSIRTFLGRSTPSGGLSSCRVGPG